jgi:small GTP-binding protein
MDKLVVGILAHVDAGKTTLSESLLYISGKIGKLGRVDNKNAYLDTYELEKTRGITIFSKQAIFSLGGIEIVLLDTPGHVDFSSEMERTLQVLDYAILVISGADGVQGHTRTLWRLLDKYNVPVFIFVNKMDQDGTDISKLIKEIKKHLDEACIDFGQPNEDNFYDQLSMCDEIIMENYLQTGTVQTEFIKNAIRSRKVFPCYFGSALKLQGIEQFMEGLGKYTVIPGYSELFGARVFKITRDDQGSRLTHMKITGGKLRVKDVLKNNGWEEKVNQIRIYSGQKYEAVNELEAGTICAVPGFTKTKPGEGLGIEKTSNAPVLQPVLFYRIILPEGCDVRAMMPKLRQIEEEEPELHIVWEEQLQEIQVQIMGEVQLEILQSIIKSRFGITVRFDSGRVLYKETIANMVEGVGHFEPLRHYAEVHLLIEPGEPGSGLQFGTICSEEVLGRNWQRLVITHLEEKMHKGVLTGSAITDMKITLVSGRAHNKHTEGGDFREATYRAVRQGLMEAQSVLLEPFYSFQLELPEKMVGKAMADIEKMHGKCEISLSDGETVVLTGSAPVTAMRNYQMEVTAYTKGLGRLFYSLKGYEACHNAEEIIEETGYDPENDFANPTGSVFCSQGTGFGVTWDKVKEYMHVEGYLNKKDSPSEETQEDKKIYTAELVISPEEVDLILNKTYNANQGKKSAWKGSYQKYKRSYETVRSYYTSKQPEIKDEYLLVDGYNIIHAWSDLKDLADTNMDGARIKLLDSMSNYQGLRKSRIIVVFDAYRVLGHIEEVLQYNNIYVVYTKEAQTADQYIEKFSHDNSKKYNITVATSDGLQQVIIRGAGCSLLSARELKAEVDRAVNEIWQLNSEKHGKGRNYLMDSLTKEAKQHMTELVKREDD